ncbi:hypothetical protein SELMODRAFT_407541 [Selaginella moellendorffii]|uniref:DNA2/NAM7 helicase-like C-terminal domain-containing protein n=1 Tax=Selaginella moellendorffii TaxID=88036 RepID=D8R5Y4_SELML|nr:hypothetical protein SELMODRAFT_407541 [Selaginella moellendorffii]
MLLAGNNASGKLVESLALFRNADQRTILHGLKKLVKIFDETVYSSEATESNAILDLTDEEYVNKEVVIQEAMTDECVKTATEETASDQYAKPEVASDRKKRPVSQDVPSCKKQRLEGKVEEFYDRAAFPAMLDEWHKRVLSLDIWSMHGDHSEELLEVPLTFQSYKHYLEIFRPLCFEEFKAHLERSLETMDLSRSDVVTAFSLRQEGYFHLVEFDGHTVEKRNNLLVKVYLPHSCERLSKLREMLVTESTWHLNKLTSVTTFIREQQAMAAMHLFPLLETILSASPPREISRTQSLPPQLRSKLRREYNESQLSSIAAVADQMISLIQGPPGTGKTRTILGIVSALLAHANEEAGKAEEHEMLDVLTDNHQTEFRDKLKATRISHGVYNYDGGTYWPSIVRVGDTKRVHSQAMAVHIDRLVAKRMAENAGVHNAHSPQELRSKLDEVLGNMQALAAPAEVESQDGIPKLDKLAGLQEQQRLLLSELIKVENREHGFLMGSNRKKKQAMKLEVLREADVVLTTLSGCGGHIYSTLMEFIATRDAQAAEMLFDAVIIDEAAQAVEPSTLIPLQLLKATRGKCILIRDPKQLPATVLSVPASRLLFDCSMFESFPVSMLTTQYRMHPEIRSFPSTHYYDGQLKDGSTVLHGNRSAPFHRESHTGFFDIRDGQERPGSMQSLTNPDEAEFIFQLLRVLKERYLEEVRPGRIGVITPYQEQRKVLQENMRSLHSGIDVNTVDSFQGREADIIVLSTVRASFGDSQAGVGFLADVRRMNVALTRAKFSLWVVGNARTLERNPDWKALPKTVALPQRNQRLTQLQLTTKSIQRFYSAERINDKDCSSLAYPTAARLLRQRGRNSVSATVRSNRFCDSLAFSFEQTVGAIYGDLSFKTEQYKELRAFYNALKLCMGAAVKEEFLSIQLLQEWHKTLIPGGGKWRTKDVFVSFEDGPEKRMPCLRLEERLDVILSELKQRIEASRGVDEAIISAAGTFVHGKHHYTRELTSELFPCKHVRREEDMDWKMCSSSHNHLW